MPVISKKNIYLRFVINIINIIRYKLHCLIYTEHFSCVIQNKFHKLEHNDIDNQLCYKFILITKPIIYLLRQFKSILISLCCANYIPSKLKIESQKIAYTMKTSFSFKKIYIFF